MTAKLQSWPAIPVANLRPRTPPDRVIVTWCEGCGLVRGAYYTKPLAKDHTCPVCLLPMKFIRYQLAKRRP